VGVFYFGAPLAFIFGSPLSGSLLELHGTMGLAGWQWLFLIEGTLASLVGVWAFWYLDNRPEDARWLDAEERTLLRSALDDDARAASSHGPHHILAALVDRRVLLLSAIYLLIQMSVYGVIFYLPQQVAALLGTTVGLRVGLVAALPWLCALAVTWYVPRRADRTGGHRRWAVALLVLAGLGIGASGLAHNPSIGLIALCCAASGFIAAQPLFWTFPTRYLTGAAAAGGIALINSLGGLGGFIAPSLRTAAERAFSSTSAGLIVLGVSSLLAALMIGTLLRRDDTDSSWSFQHLLHRAR
jgi:MFS family permease